MRKVTKAFAGALALITAVSAFTGCSDTPATSGTDSGGDAAVTTTTQTQQVMSEDSGVKDAVSNVEVSEDYKNIEVDKKIVWMAWWDIQEASPAVEMFKTLYGTPETIPEGYSDVPAENVFVNVSVGFPDRYTALATKVQSGDSPDCFPFEINNYPYSVYQKLFAPVGDLFGNFEGDDWADYKDAIDMFQWGGQYYCPIMDLNIDQVLFYRKSVVENAGLTDPWELFENGEWTWTEFENMCSTFTDVDAGKYAMDGWNPENAMVATTGTPLVGLEDGKLVSNLNNANIEKCMDLLIKFDDTKQGWRYPRETINGWQINLSEWRNGNTLFFADGTFQYESMLYKFAQKDQWDEDEIGLVPFPQMDGADAYYQSMKQDSIMLVSGSKNVDGYKAWIYANLVAVKDPDIKAAAREQSKNEFHWTDDLLDRLDTFKDPDTFVAVFDFKNGIGQDLGNTSSQDTPVETLTKYPYMNGETYTSVRAASQGVIEDRIKEMNASVGA